MKVTDEGLVPFLEALQNNQSLESLSIDWLSTHPDQLLYKENDEKCSKEFTETAEHDNSVTML